LAFLNADREGHSLEDLVAALGKASPAGRLYLATLMFRRDNDRGRASLEDITDAPFTIYYQHGCMFPGEKQSAGEIAQLILGGSPPPGLRPETLMKTP
jgi:hypothetical protein